MVFRSTQTSLPIIRAVFVALVCGCALSAAAQEQYSVALSAASVAVEGQEGGNFEQLHFPELLQETLLLGPGDTIELKFTLRDKSSGLGVAPHQVMVRATGEKGGHAFFLARSAGDAASGGRSASISSAVLAKQLGSSPGRVKLALIVGDEALDTPMLWDFAQAEVSFSDSDRALAEVQPAAVTGPLPEIIHVHRTPDTRPPAFAAILFTAIVIGELAALLWFLSQSSAVNLGAWPTGSYTASACLAFHAGIASILGLYLLFWTHLNILQTLPILAVLGLFTTISGHQALSGIAENRSKVA